jgi:hypothetical protein
MDTDGRWALQRRLLVVVILFLVMASAAAADEPCRTTYRTIASRSPQALVKALELLSDRDVPALEVLASRGEIVLVEPDTNIYVKEDKGASLYLMRLPGSPDVLWAVAPKGFDCPTPAPKRPTKKPKPP